MPQRQKIALIKEVNDRTAYDTGIEMSLIGGTPEKFTTKQIQYEALGGLTAKTAEFSSFSDTAKVMEKDGKAIVLLDVFQISSKVSFGVAEGYEPNDFDSEYDKSKTPQLIGAGKAVEEYCHTPALDRRARLIANFLQNHRFTKAVDGFDADFNIDSKYKVVKDTDKWNEDDAPVVADIRDMVKLTGCTQLYMNRDTLTNMLTNGDLYTADNANGTRRNYVLNENSDQTKVVTKHGRVVDPLATVDIMVVTPQGEYAEYFDNGIVVGTKPNSLRLKFGGVPFRDNNGRASIIKGEWIWSIKQNNDPIVDEFIYYSAPMVVPTTNTCQCSYKVY